MTIKDLIEQLKRYPENFKVELIMHVGHTCLGTEDITVDQDGPFVVISDGGYDETE